MKRKYEMIVRSELERTKNFQPELLTEKDMEHLPEVVRKYLLYTGCLGRQKIVGLRTECTGGIRSAPGEEYMTLKSVQYNFMDLVSRSFYIVAKKRGIPAIGLHIYQNARATFQVRLLGLFTVVNAKGPKLDQGETVTVLNDMCVMAPGSLIDRRIEWETVDSRSVKAIFTNDKICVSAVLHFDEEGKLINFVSNDRFETDGVEYKNFPWETPLAEYREFNGYLLPSRARLIYKRPEGDFCYGEFEIKGVEYNGRSFR